MKVKCPKCKKTFKGDDYIKALLECPYYTCGLKESTEKVLKFKKKKK